jgi:hypothetical protein
MDEWMDGVVWCGVVWCGVVWCACRIEERDGRVEGSTVKPAVTARSLERSATMTLKAKHAVRVLKQTIAEGIHDVEAPTVLAHASLIRKFSKPCKFEFKGGKEGGRKGRREGGREGGRQGGCEGGWEDGRMGGREGGRKEGGRRDRGTKYLYVLAPVIRQTRPTI